MKLSTEGNINAVAKSICYNRHYWTTIPKKYIYDITLAWHNQKDETIPNISYLLSNSENQYLGLIKMLRAAETDELRNPLPYALMQKTYIYF